MDTSNPKCPRCGGASCVIGANRLKDEMYSCHECDYTWPVHGLTVEKPKEEWRHGANPEVLDNIVRDTVGELAQPAEPGPEAEVEPTPVKTALALSAAQAGLESLYGQLNAKLFGGKLPSLVITIQSKGRKQAVAWYAPERWEDGEKAASAEINFCAEYLNKGKEALVETMIHEMVHALNARDGIKDCGRSGRYHNKKFRHAAEAVGLLVESSKACGHAHTSLGPRLESIVSEVNLRDEAFDLVRKEKQKGKGGGTKLVKWTCGCGRNMWMKTDGEGIKCELCDSIFAKGG